jgi:hypothetical protein
MQLEQGAVFDRACPLMRLSRQKYSNATANVVVRSHHVIHPDIPTELGGKKREFDVDANWTASSHPPDAHDTNRYSYLMIPYLGAGRISNRHGPHPGTC